MATVGAAAPAGNSQLFLTPVATVVKCKIPGAKGHPLSRGGCSTTVIGDSMFVVGGAARTGGHFDDVHKFDLRAGKWVPVTVTGAKPPKMSGHSAVAFGDKLVVFGGMNMEAQEMYNDVWVLHTAASPLRWEKPTVSGSAPSPRNAHSSCAFGDQMLVFGGSSPTDGPMADLHSLDVSDWSNLKWSVPATTGAGPTKREMHIGFVRPGSEAKGGSGDNLLVIMGGRSETGVAADAYVLDLDSMAWQPAAPFPLARCACSVAVDRQRHQLCLFGGFDGKEVLAKDVFFMDYRIGSDPREWPWTAATPELPLAARFGGAACVHRGSLLLFGGVNALPKENIFFVKVLLGSTRSEDVSVPDEAAAGSSEAPAAGAGAGAGSGTSSGAGAGSSAAPAAATSSAAAAPTARPSEAETAADGE